MNAYYTAIIVLSILSMGIMSLFVTSNKSLPKLKTRQFLALFAMVSICAAAEWTGMYLQGAASWTRVPHILIKLVELSTVPFTGILSADILEGESKWRKPVLITLGVHILLEILSAVFGFIFYVDEQNIYYHGQFYWIYIAAWIISMLYLVLQSSKITKYYQYSHKNILMLVLLFLIIGLFLQMYDSTIRVDWICMSMTVMMFYIFYCEIVQQTDALTHLLNRRAYENRVRVHDKRMAILFFDVDKFKQVNDIYGHRVGDKCLAIIGEELKRVYASIGQCYRYGGDEFCVITEEYSSDVEKLNSEFFKRLGKRREEFEWLPNVTIGYAIYEPGTMSFEDAVNRADEMMYFYKRRNKKENEE